MNFFLNKIKFNWIFYIGLALIIRVLFPNISLYSYLAILISLHQILNLFNSFGVIIPIRYIFGTFMCLQMFIGPVFQYNGLDKFVFSFYSMKVPEDVYFSYVIPAVICFIVGLHIRAEKFNGELLDENRIKEFSEKNPDQALIFIGVGFFASIFSTIIPTDFSTTEAVGQRGGGGWIFFILYLIGCLKYIGAFLLILGKSKMKTITIVVVYGSIIATSLGTGMFHDLLTWIIMLAAIIAIRYKPSIYIKIIFAFCFIILAFVIQIVKDNYRTAIWQSGGNSGLATFAQAAEQSESSNDVFDIKSLALSNVRINQGFIITNIMKTVPEQVPFANGEELGQILEAAFLPRVLAPDKLEAGDQKIFNQYTGLGITKATMGLSSVGDAYINFGIIGGSVFMFFLGLLYNEILKGFYRYSKNFPILLLFTPLVFYFPIRPDSELQTNLGHVIKSTFLILIIFTVWKSNLQLQFSRKLNKED